MKVWVVTEERETRSGMTWLSLSSAVASLHRMEAGALVEMNRLADSEIARLDRQIRTMVSDEAPYGVRDVRQRCKDAAGYIRFVIEYRRRRGCGRRNLKTMVVISAHQMDVLP